MNGYLTLIDLVVVAGAAAVIPAALGRWWGAWGIVAASTALAFSLEPGPVAALLALPWVVLAAAATLAAAAVVLRSGRLVSVDGLAAVAAPGWALVAGAALVDSCAGWNTFGFGEPITRLTAVHFTYAGVATTALGLAARRSALAAGSVRRHRMAGGALVLAMAAPPAVAAGFSTGSAWAQVGGAVLMTAGAYLLAATHLAEGWPVRRARAGKLLMVSGLSVWAPMALAVAWAAAQHTGGPALSIPDMVRIHGSLNAFGFVGCALVARHLSASAAPRPRPAGLAARELAASASVAK